MGTTSTSSRTPSEPRTGAATTTSPKRHWPRWPSNRTAYRHGSSSAPEPEERQPPSAGTLPNGTPTRLCVVDPEGSAFLPSYQGQVAECAGSRIEGIGRPRVEPSFVPSVVDRMLGVPDGASVAAMRFLNHRLGISAAPQPAPMSSAPCGSPARCVQIKKPALLSRSCATAAPGIPTHTTMTPGSRNRESTSTLIYL